VTLALYALLVAVFMNDAPTKSVEPEPPPIEVGALVGRDGVAFGPGVLLQGNLRRLAALWFRWNV
jgi:hypothetical protein